MSMFDIGEFDVFYRTYMREHGVREYVIEDNLNSFSMITHSFQHPDTQEVWDFWKASRRAIRIEVHRDPPSAVFDSYEDGWEDALTHLEMCLDEIGLRIADSCDTH